VCVVGAIVTRACVSSDDLSSLAVQLNEAFANVNDVALLTQMATFCEEQARLLRARIAVNIPLQRETARVV
jgi:hypothetical protein